MEQSWKIKAHPRFIKEAKKLGVYDRVKSLLSDFEERLRSNDVNDVEHVLDYLRRQPIIARVENYKLRRLRMGRYRLFYFIDDDRREIVFTIIKLRKEKHETYKF